VTITGTAFTGATKVLFNGKAATFTVVSSTRITATVPAGATTGRIKVTTPGGTATSKKAFRVT
jgi:large repetitive protein